MRLYHGGTTAVDKPKIITAARALDFGSGFYCTSDIQQANNWALRKARFLRGSSSTPVLSVYEFFLKEATGLAILEFPVANRDWLDFVARHRTDISLANEYDLIIGPVANDRTFQVIDTFMFSPREELDYQVALRDIETQKLVDQYTFSTTRALEHLMFVESQSL